VVMLLCTSLQETGYNMVLKTVSTLGATGGGGTVTAVTGSGNIASSGGTTPNITFTGTLPVANGGTNLTSFTANGVVYASSSSALATGSALTFDGTNLGIGTSSPAYSLEVSKSQDAVTNIAVTNASSGTAAQTRLRLNNGGSNFGTISHTGASFTTSGIFRADGTYLYGNGTGGLTLTTGAVQPIYFAINNSEAMRLDTSGNLGLGVTPSASSGGGNFNLSGDILGGSAVTLGTNWYFNGGFKYKATGTASRFYLDSSGAFSWYTAPSGTAGNAITFTQAMTLDASGNLGIGTTSPSASAILDAQSTTKGVRMPNMTTTQKNAISSPAAGLMVFDTTLAKLCVYSGSAWQTITSV